LLFRMVDDPLEYDQTSYLQRFAKMLSLSSAEISEIFSDLSESRLPRTAVTVVC
jgi:hypothetical protein